MSRETAGPRSTANPTRKFDSWHEAVFRHYNGLLPIYSVVWSLSACALHVIIAAVMAILNQNSMGSALLDAARSSISEIPLHLFRGLAWGVFHVSIVHIIMRFLRRQSIPGALVYSSIFIWIVRGFLVYPLDILFVFRYFDDLPELVSFVVAAFTLLSQESLFTPEAVRNTRTGSATD